MDFSELLSEGYLYPLLAVVAVTLIVVGVLSAWRSEDLAGLRKAELKREIILELRRQMVGMTGDALSRAVGLEPFKTVKLLEELQRDNILTSHTNTQRLTIWRIRGLPTGPPKKF
jgi:hypothetical protein